MRARERERPLLGIEPPFYKCTHNNVSGISHSPSVYARKTWRSFPYEWEFVRSSSRGQRIVFRLPPYDTPRAACCNKAKFRVHRRHAAGGVCEQRITALRKYIYRLAEKPAFGRLHCYGASSTAALRRRSDDYASMTEP